MTAMATNQGLPPPGWETPGAGAALIYLSVPSLKVWNEHLMMRGQAVRFHSVSIVVGFEFGGARQPLLLFTYFALAISLQL
jgi:hypothetical protein